MPPSSGSLWLLLAEQGAEDRAQRTPTVGGGQHVLREPDPDLLDIVGEPVVGVASNLVDVLGFRRAAPSGADEEVELGAAVVDPWEAGSAVRGNVPGGGVPGGGGGNGELSVPGCGTGPGPVADAGFGVASDATSAAPFNRAVIIS